MKHLENILVGIDFSIPCEKALREAGRIAQWSDAKVTALHVIDARVLDGIRDSVKLDRMKATEAARERLERYVAEHAGEGAGIHCSVDLGHPFGCLLEGVEETGSELLVLGAQGLDASSAVGEIASRCVRKIPAAVLLVRRTHERPFSSVVSCVDYSEASGRALETAIALAEHENATVRVLHVALSMPAGLGDYGAYATLLPEYAEESFLEEERARLAEWAAPFFADHPDVMHEVEVLERINPRQGIIDCLNDTGADLVVLGTRGRTGLKMLLMGTTAEKVISHAPCSVLAVKPEDFSYPSR